MRASRLISLLCLLQVRGSMTAAELARELEVSERTVARDVLALGAAGVPVYAERGRAGGYRLLGGYRSKLTGLHEGEAEALFLAGVPAVAREMGMAEEVAAARLKISAALAPSFRDASARVEHRFHLDAPRWFREAETPPSLPELAEAVWRSRTVSARYRRERGEVERTLDPHGLVLKAGVWYLVARVREDFRIYRVGRFAHVEPTGETFDRAPDFDLPEFWAQRAEQFARALLTERITVRVSPAGLTGLRAIGEGAAVAEALEEGGAPDEEGRVTVVLPVESMEVAHHQVLGLGPEAEVLAPAELRARLAETTRRAAELYQS